jgi:hypothetical protein
MSGLKVTLESGAGPNVAAAGLVGTEAGNPRPSPGMSAVIVAVMSSVSDLFDWLARAAAKASGSKL